MSSFTPSFAWSSFDSLPTGSPNKVVKATAIGIEMNNIQSAVNSKLDAAGGTATGTLTVDNLAVSGTFSGSTTIDGGTY